MKATFLTISLLTASITLFSQPSRRGHYERNNLNHGSENRTANYRTSGEQRSVNRGFDQSRLVAQVNRGETRDYQRFNHSEPQGRDLSYTPAREYRDRVSRNPSYERSGRYNSSFYSRPYRENREYGRSDYFERGHYQGHMEFRRPGRFESIRHGYGYRPVSMEYHRRHFLYREPFRAALIWSVGFSQSFGLLYPEVRYLRYPIGHRIASVPAYNADAFIGEVASIYGDVTDSYYADETDEFTLYFGDSYPNHIFSVVIPGSEARKFSNNPDQYFNGQHVIVTGYVTRFENKPEIQVRQASQIEVY